MNELPWILDRKIKLLILYKYIYHPRLGSWLVKYLSPYMKNEAFGPIQIRASHFRWYATLIMGRNFYFYEGHRSWSFRGYTVDVQGGLG